jgi:type 1 glutamine amidotransferase
MKHRSKTCKYFLNLLTVYAAVATGFAAELAGVKTNASAPLTWITGKRVLVVGGGSSHDFNRWFNAADVATLRSSGGLSVNYTENSALTTRELKEADVLVMSTNQKNFDTPEFREALMQFAEAGKGLVLLHPAVWYNWPWPEYNRVLVGGGSRGHDRLGEFEVKILKQHPVTKGVASTFKITDELYHFEPDATGSTIEVLARTSPSAEKVEYPSVWLVNHPKARIVCIAPGHDSRSHELPEFKRLLVNAVNWTARQEPDP